ncbi:uncharacterized protein LOC134694360 [Mytilus trossulus]|uniref:uncharacterized protein LOC134694360 n=1 Tax=Mytilus trossulus TaxID=6551 RepID=UPI003006600A
MLNMSAIVTLIAILAQIQMVSGIGNDTIKMKVQKGETVVLKCSTSEGEPSWLGPDVINSGEKELAYFLKDKHNPTLNQTKYSLAENEGSYDLLIGNFLKANTGCYKCRFENDGLFNETRYYVSLLDKEYETTTRTFTAGSFRKTSSITKIAKTTNFQIPNDLEGNNEHTLIILLVMIPIVLLGGSITIVVVLARVKGTSIGEMLESLPLSCQRDTER